MSVYVYSVPIHIDIIINRYIKGNGDYMCNLTVVKNPGLMTRVTYSNKKKKNNTTFIIVTNDKHKVFAIKFFLYFDYFMILMNEF